MHDVAVVGGGHNGLVSSVLLAKAGLKVCVLEKRSHVGGAATSREIFPGTGAMLSEYAYLVSMLPDQLRRTLGLHAETRERRIASFTPEIRSGRHVGLLHSNESAERTAQSFSEFTGTAKDYDGFSDFYERTGEVARAIAPTLLEPLRSRADLQREFHENGLKGAWDMMFERPIEEGIETRMENDTVRGVVYTDANIGVMPLPQDPAMLQNKTLLYHVIGNGDGKWKVPVGGMGAITTELRKKAEDLGVEFRLDADVKKIRPGNPHEIAYSGRRGGTAKVEARFVLSGVPPSTLARLTGAKAPPRDDEGSVFKVNMLLDELPTAKGDVASEDAFNGTFHLDEKFTQIQGTGIEARTGKIPTNPPGEVYCHTLTDRSILPRKSKQHTLTLFGLNVPYRAFSRRNNNVLRASTMETYLTSLGKHLETPIKDALARDDAGNLCVEAKTALDIEDELGMPQGNIFHGGLSWPFAERKGEVGTWGVETAFERIYVCGSGARRGGCVSGIPGYNAAMKVLGTR